MAPSTKEYRWIGDHAQDLASGAMIGRGEFVKLTEEQTKEEHNKRLLDSGLLIPVPVPEKKEG